MPFILLGDQLRKHPEQRLQQGDIEAVLETIHGKRAFMLAIAMCESIIELDMERNQPPKLALVNRKENFMPRDRQMTLQKNSPLKEPLSRQYINFYS